MLALKFSLFTQHNEIAYGNFQLLQDIEGLLARLQLLEEHEARADVNIWDEPADK